MKRVHAIVVIAILGLGMLSPSIAFSQANLTFPKHIGYVNDFADFLKPETEAFIEEGLRLFEQEKKHEIVVVTTDSLQGTTPEDLRIRWFKEWGIGKEGAENGLLILIVPPERVVTIEVGYGLEGAIPDLVSQQVGDIIMVPKIRDGDPDGAVIAGVEAFMKLTEGEEVSFGIVDSNAGANSQIGLVFLAVMLMLIGWGIYDRIAMVQKLQKFFRSRPPRGVLVLALSLMGGFIAGMGEYFPPLIWAGIFCITVGAVIFRFTKNAGTVSTYRGGMWFGGGRGFGGGGGGFGGFGGGSSGGGGSTSRW